MHILSRAVWSLVGSLACLGAIVNAADVVEIDVVFPRSNETYAPTDKFPIVFALQNAELAKRLKPSIYSFIRNNSDQDAFGSAHQDMTYANMSSEPYFVWRYVNIETEGSYKVFSTVSWISCDESGENVGILGNDTNFSVNFTIKKGAQEVDLVAATANDKTCSAKDGVTINVTDQTREYPANGIKCDAGICAVLASSSPTPTANPCRVKVDTAAAATVRCKQKFRFFGAKI